MFIRILMFIITDKNSVFTDQKTLYDYKLNISSVSVLFCGYKNARQERSD